MQVINAVDPDNALANTIRYVTPVTSMEMGSRNGPVIRFTTPVSVVWAQPTNRILWSPQRDCNPFLHLIESAWMLAGRNDVETVEHLAKQMRQYSDDGSTLNGAYGFRWRHHFAHDQIQSVVAELLKDRTSRRCVIQMWDGRHDLEARERGSKDLPCNTAIYFDPCDDVLNMTVTNRSNDAVWGLFGANVVHMSILHEYVAALTGFRLGVYTQVANNLHFYTENPVTKKIAAFHDLQGRPRFDPDANGWRDAGFDSNNEPLFTGLANMDQLLADRMMAAQLNSMLSAFLRGDDVTTPTELQTVPFFPILEEMMNAYTEYKQHGPRDGDEYLQHCGVHSRWIANGRAWLRRRPSYA